MKNSVLLRCLLAQLAFICCSCGGSNSGSSFYFWATQAGGQGDDGGAAIRTLNDGSSLVVGEFEGTAVFGLGEQNETTLSSSGESDIYTAKYEPDGILDYVTRSGIDSQTSSYRIELHPLGDGSLVSTGCYEVEVVLGSNEANETVLTSLGDYDVFVARYLADGILEWAKGIGGPGADYSYDISTDTEDSILVAGAFSGESVFGLGEARETTLSAEGGLDAFLAKYSTDGSLSWVVQASSQEDEQSRIVDSLDSGSSLVIGYYEGATTFGLGEPNETTLVPHGDENVFLAKYTPDGEIVFARCIIWATGTVDTDIQFLDASVETDDSIVVVGIFKETSRFGTGQASDESLTSGGNYDMFIAKFSPDGSPLWAVKAGGNEQDDFVWGNSVDITADGSVFVTGMLKGAITFGAGEPNENTIESKGEDSASASLFIAQYTSSGELAWVRASGGSGIAGGFSISAMDDGSCFVTGGVYGETTFWQGESDTIDLATSDNQDVLVIGIVP